MTSVELPSRAKPEVLHAVCGHLRQFDGSKKQNLYDEMKTDQRQIRAALDYGAKLGFLTVEDGFATNTGRGSGLSYARNIEDESSQTVFQEAIESYDAYRDTLLRIHAEDLVEDVKDKPAIKQSSFKQKAEESTGDSHADRAINLLIKTCQAAGLGKFVTGRKGFETRLEISDEYDEFINKLADKYQTPEPEETVEDEPTITKGGAKGDSTDIDEIVLKADQVSEQLKLKVEYDVTNKSENQIASLVQHIRSYN
ncbi:hypothetical protein KU306_01135 [Haloferax larsenii]|uniref:DUF5343 domain-containing protein n=1 Tax=Haloferax larsenii TaxID=302484 RepID=A0ABY5RDZ3_HALLR|nr:hypothetical protein [Haloferax larsenii]UVE50541.1 hypothetical protein KU306_01135 [Haloferax larsenii]